MFSFGFYNSKDGDRKYNASHMGRIFDGVIQDGVFGTIKADNKTAFQIEPTTEPSLSVVINKGKAWLAHTWNILDSAANISFGSVNPNRKRTDAICIEVNNSYSETGFTPRTNRIIVVPGTAVASSSAIEKPDLTPYQKKNSVGETIIWRYPLAYVTIYGSNIHSGTYDYHANVVESINISSAINPSGALASEKYITWTPIVTGATMDSSDYIPNNFDSQFSAFLDTKTADFNDWFDRISTSIIGDYVALGSGEPFQPNIQYYEKNEQDQYIPTTDVSPQPGKTYYYLDTAESIVELNDKIDNKYLYGTGNPPGTLEVGQIYFQYEV